MHATCPEYLILLKYFRIVFGISRTFLSKLNFISSYLASAVQESSVQLR
jgi:hypothetical protein